MTILMFYHRANWSETLSPASKELMATRNKTLAKYVQVRQRRMLSIIQLSANTTVAIFKVNV
jgi:hypothetical protein